MVKSNPFSKMRKEARYKKASKTPRKTNRYRTIVVTDKCSLSCQMQKMGLGSYTSPWNLRANKTNPMLDSLYKGNRKMYNVIFQSKRM